MKTITVHMVGNAHLDPVWLWPWQSGADEAIATCRSACDLLDDFPHAVFTRGEAWVYEQLRTQDPALFERVKAHVTAGRWSVVNGWWVQPDGGALDRSITDALAAKRPEGIDHVMCFYGVGNHGGGPTRKCVEWIAAHQDYAPDVRLEFSTPDRYFAAVESAAAECPVVEGELLHHAIRLEGERSFGILFPDSFAADCCPYGTVRVTLLRNSVHAFHSTVQMPHEDLPTLMDRFGTDDGPQSLRFSLVGDDPSEADLESHLAVLQRPPWTWDDYRGESRVKMFE